MEVLRSIQIIYFECNHPTKAETLRRIRIDDKTSGQLS